MIFNIRNFFSFSIRWLTSSGWTPRRLIIALAFYAVFPVLQMTVWIGFWLDAVFFRRYAAEPVVSPVFIIGNPRSGTTFLHRLISKDEKRFTTMRMWEILFAPSVTQRMVYRAVMAIARRIGGSFGDRLSRMEQKWNHTNGMHEISFTEPEEDDYLLLHIWSALTTGLSAGITREALPYTYFDSEIPVTERKRILRFYKKCIQRHLHAERLQKRAEPGIYLAKNPALCPKVRSTLDEFPDAKFIYLVRSPLEMVPSYMSMMKHSWEMVGVNDQEEDLREYITLMAKHWYSYPIDQMEKAQADHVIVYYQDLIRDPESIVRYIYKTLDFHIGSEFDTILRHESAKARSYRSRHDYSLDENGLGRDRLMVQFKPVLERFDFDCPADGKTGSPSAPAPRHMS